MSDDERTAKRAAREKADHLLTMETVEKIFGAMRDGTLPLGLNVERVFSQVIVNTGSAWDKGFPPHVYEALREMFPGGEERFKWGIRSKGKGKARKHFDTYEYRVDLRPVDGEISTDWSPDRPPRLEIWHILKPHEHRDWKGVIEAGRPRWRCGACKQPMLVREARKEGLVP